MSFKATAWAWEQTGLKPSPKMVLLCLADCHNPRHGCFPSQAYIADQCEMDRATVNRHLKSLEERGLIRREKAFDHTTKRQLPTRYHLAFEGAEGNPEVPQESNDPVSQNATRAVSQNDPEPCRKTSESRVAKCNSNLVKEKINNPRERVGASAREGARVYETSERPDGPAPEAPPPASRPAPHLSKLVQGGSPAEDDWNRWLAHHGLPTLPAFAPVICHDGKEGYDLPFRYPPHDPSSTQHMVAQRFVSWRKAQTDARYRRNSGTFASHSAVG